MSKKFTVRYLFIILAMALTLLVFSTSAFTAINMTPYLMASTPTSIVVQVECGSTGTVTVDYGTTTAYGSTKNTGTTATTTNGTTVYSITLSGLTANTTYHYRVKQGTGAYTADKTFKTQPSSGTTKIGFVADTRSNTSTYTTILNAYKTAGVKAIIDAGDVAVTGAYNYWKSMFFTSTALGTYSSIPVSIAVGNHEGWSQNTKAFVAGVGGKDSYYSFDTGDLHVLVLNTQDTRSVGSAQYNFAKTDLTNSKKPWKVVAFHAPAYVYGGHTGDAAMQTMSTNIFEPGGVDMVLGGHSHFYQHNRKNSSGLDHVIVGGGGASLDTPANAPSGSGVTTVKNSKNYCYSIIDVTSTSFKLTAKTTGGTVIETISKTQPAAMMLTAENITPNNVALNKTATADSEQTQNPASAGNDGNATTRWCAADANDNHWWQVDLGDVYNLTGSKLTWERSGAWQYKVETSLDNTNWNTKVDNTDNTISNQVNSDDFTSTARYIRVTVTHPGNPSWASFYEFEAYGALYTPVNVAVNKAVTTDGAQSGNPASNGNDGNSTTRWCAVDANNNHWWQVDLGSNFNLFGSKVTWEKTGAYKYKIETSTDNVNWTLLADKTANSTSAQVMSDDFADTATGRYVRITITQPPSGFWSSFYEFEVYGIPNDSTNLAYKKTATADSVQAGNPIANGNDGDATTTRWAAADANPNHWWQVDLGASYNLTGSQVTWERAGDWKYKIEVSNDNANWTLAVDQTANATSTQVNLDDFVDNMTGRYVRITVTDPAFDWWASFYEFEVYGDTTI